MSNEHIHPALAAALDSIQRQPRYHRVAIRVDDTERVINTCALTARDAIENVIAYLPDSGPVTVTVEG